MASHEQQLANSILQKILTLPNAKYLAHLMQTSLPQIEEKFAILPLFNWLLTGEYTQGIIEKWGGDSPDINDQIKLLIDNVIDASVPDPYVNQKILKFITDTIDDKLQNTVSKAKMINALHNVYNLEGEGDGHDSDLYAAGKLSKFLLTGKVDKASDVHGMYSDFISRPNELISEIINMLDSWDRNKVADYLHGLYGSGEIDIDELPENERISYLLQEIMKVDEKVNPEDIQTIYEYFYGSKPTAPVPPVIQ